MLRSHPQKSKTHKEPVLVRARAAQKSKSKDAHQNPCETLYLLKIDQSQKVVHAPIHLVFTCQICSLSLNPIDTTDLLPRLTAEFRRCIKVKSQKCTPPPLPLERSRGSFPRTEETRPQARWNSWASCRQCTQAAAALCGRIAVFVGT